MARRKRKRVRKFNLVHVPPRRRRMIWCDVCTRTITLLLLDEDVVLWWPDKTIPRELKPLSKSPGSGCHKCHRVKAKAMQDLKL